MTDQRLNKMAEILVQYALKLQKGDKLLIEANMCSAPLIKELYKEALKIGAFPEARITMESMKELLYKYGNHDQLTYISPIERIIFNQYDASLYIWGEENTKSLTNVDPQKISVNMEAQGELFSEFMKNVAEKKLKWCGTIFATQAYAQNAEMSLDEYEDFIFSACKLDTQNPVSEWEKLSKEQERLRKILNTKKELRFSSSTADLIMSVEGRNWVNCDGSTGNFPDGELFTTPNRTSANGRIKFSYPAIFNGREVENVELVFKNGKVIQASAEKGENYLITMLDTDEGSRYIGEIAFGTNYGINKFTKNILFDEKIGGTIHLAVGAASPESGGGNESAIHWDMICDMQTDGQVFADGELIYENGKFLI